MDTQGVTLAINRIILLIDSDIVRCKSDRTVADRTLAAFAIALSRTIHTASGAPKQVPILISEHTCPRLAGPKSIQTPWHYNTPSDADLLLEVDVKSVVMEREITQPPLRQVIADFALPAAAGEPFAGPVMTVRPAPMGNGEDLEALAKCRMTIPET